MLELKKQGNTFQVTRDGSVVFSGTMAQAMREYSRLMAEQLNSKPQTRTGGKRIYSR